MNSFPYPKLQEFQNAHRKLLREYVAAIDVASRLPFFINLTRVLIQDEKESFYTKLNREGFFFLAPFTWKPFVSFLVESHIKSKMGELSVAYNQLSLRLPDGRNSKQLKNALESAVTECNQLNNTLTNWKNGKAFMAGAVPVALGWFTSWLGTDNLLSALPQLGIKISENFSSGNYLLFIHLFVWFITSLFLLFTLFNQAYEGKRSIFLPTLVTDRIKVPTYNIYSSEDDLFKLIGHKKKPEIAIDTLAGIFFMFIIGVGFYLRNHLYPFSIKATNLVGLILIIPICAYIIVLYNRRWK